MAGEQQIDAVSGDRDSDERGPSVRRRALLRTGANVGASAALVWGFGRTYVTADDLGRITYAVTRPEPGTRTLEPRTKEVPVAWHQSLRLAIGAQEAIRDAGLGPLIGSFVVPGSYDEPEATIAVDAVDEGVSGALEDLTEGVNLDVSVINEIPPKPDADTGSVEPYQISELEPERVPGGVVCESEYGSGTLTPALFDRESRSRFFATSNHVFGESGTKETEHEGEPLSILYDDDTYHIGNVERGYPVADVVRVDPVDAYSPASEIERASPSRVIGQYTRAGLADLAARDEELVKLGAMSERTAGSIKGIDGVTCYTGEACKPGQLKWGGDDTLDDGDSGSVNFHEDPENPDEYVLVGGINNARTWWPGAGFTWGTAGYHLLEEYDLHF